MKIAVLTWKLHNFGTALQAFALVHYISQKADCCLLNYNLPGKEHIVSFDKKTVVSYLKKIENRLNLYDKNFRNNKVISNFQRDIDTQREKFKQFYCDIPNDPHIVSIDEKDYFNTTYDKVIVGSDQVWSPKYFCNTYFLDFVDDSKKYSYAPSIGVSSLNMKEEKFLRDKLKGHFQKISVREETGKKILQKCVPNTEVCCCVDPTLLFNKEQWQSMLSLKYNKKEKYILVYTLSNNIWYKNKINAISQWLGIEKIIYITSSDNIYFYSEFSDIVANAGPIDFLNLIINADYVITDSFHGVCFSVNFQKNFTCFERFNPKKGRHENARVQDFLNSIDLGDRYCCHNENSFCKGICYDVINPKLEKLIKESKKYLNDII